MSFEAPQTYHFDAEVVTLGARNWWSYPCRVVGRIVMDELGEAGRMTYATVEHVQALEDVWDSDERIVREGDDVIARLEPGEIKRLESEIVDRYERDRIGPLAWQYVRAM